MKHILRELALGSRISWTELDRSINLSASTVWRCIQQLQHNGLIKNFSTIGTCAKVFRDFEPLASLADGL